MRTSIAHPLGFVRNRLSGLLSDEGYHVVAVADCHSLRRLLESDAQIELVIADVQLPGGTILGIPRFAQSLGRLHDDGEAHSQVFVLTSMGSPSEIADRRDVQAALAAGYDGVIPINLERKRFLRAISDLTTAIPEKASKPELPSIPTTSVAPPEATPLDAALLAEVESLMLEMRAMNRRFENVASRLKEVGNG